MREPVAELAVTACSRIRSKRHKGESEQKASFLSESKDTHNNVKVFIVNDDMTDYITFKANLTFVSHSSDVKDWILSK